MRIEIFDFDLPRELIAQQPASPRDSARLLLLREPLEDRIFHELPALLRPGDLLVSNDTRVIPARLEGRRRNAQGGFARIEVTLHQKAAGGLWRAFARPARKLKPGDRVVFADDFEAEVEAKEENGEVVLRFSQDEEAFLQALEQHGAMPLPPYIERPKGGLADDQTHYQTVFAAQAGAVAAPTAGLHFTPALLRRLTENGIGQVQLTLHVGAGTFLPVKTDAVEDHRMHAEYGVITAEAAAKINQARRAGGRIVAVGTTSLRLLESASGADGQVHPFAGETDIFILPGYRFRAVDLLITNFHLPRSTLFMLVSAFAGLDAVRAAYEHAKQAGYRFYSYGDACLMACQSKITQNKTARSKAT